MDGSDRGTIERGIEFPPFARRHHRSGSKAHRLQHHADADRIGRKHLAEQSDRRPAAPAYTRRLDRPLLDLFARIFQHRAGQHILGFGVGRHAEARHIDADDADAVDLFRQQSQRNARCSRHAEIGDDNGVVVFRLCELEDGLANILEQLAGDQRLRVERHIADGASRAIEMRGEGQSIDAARRAGEDRGGTPHPKANPQRTKGRAHALRLVMRALRIVGGVALECLAHSRSGRSVAHLGLAGVAPDAGRIERGGLRQDAAIGRVRQAPARCRAAQSCRKRPRCPLPRRPERAGAKLSCCSLCPQTAS